MSDHEFFEKERQAIRHQQLSELYGEIKTLKETLKIVKKYASESKENLEGLRSQDYVVECAPVEIIEHNLEMILNAVNEQLEKE